VGDSFDESTFSRALIPNNRNFGKGKDVVDLTMAKVLHKVRERFTGQSVLRFSERIRRILSIMVKVLHLIGALLLRGHRRSWHEASMLADHLNRTLR
jgi:hypothetical protein